MKNRATTRIVVSMVVIIIAAAGMATKTVRAAELKELMSAAGMTLVTDGVEAPDFELKNLIGETVRLSDYRNKVVMLNFMATWCYWCRKEMPHLQKLHDKYRSKDFVIVVVFQDRKGASAVVPFVRKAGYTFAVSTGLLDPTGEVGYRYGVTGTPTTWLIDRSGRVVGWGIGYRNWSNQPAIELIEKLLQPPLASNK